MVCKIDATGKITTIAGPGTYGVIADGGPATAAFLNYPNDVAFDSKGNLYIADAENFRIRKVDIATGIITTIAGIGTIGYGGDGGPATAALFNGTNGLCFDKHGNLYVSDGGNNRIRKINTLGIISTYAGTGTPGFYGDNGPATNAQLYFPFDLAIDSIGNLFFPDADNRRVRKIDTTGIITTVAGTGIGGYNGDGIPATDAHFHPYKIAIDSFGNLFLSDSNRIRKIDLSGIIHTITGTSVNGYNGDGIMADTAEVSNPSGLAIDPCGNVYFGDVGNSRVRKVTYPLAVPTISLSGIISSPTGSSVTVTATVTNAGSSYIIHWLNHGIEFTTTTVPSVTYTKPAGIDTITARIVPTGYGCYDSTTSLGHIVSALPEGINNFGAGVVQIFPNPATASLTIISANKIQQVTISNLIGQTEFAEKFDLGKAEVNISGLPPGIYIVKVTDDQGQKTVTKIVKR